MRNRPRSPDLVTGVSIGWHFGGVAMFALGCLVIMLVADVRAARAASLRPAQLIAVAYVGFSAWALR